MGLFDKFRTIFSHENSGDLSLSGEDTRPPERRELPRVNPRPGTRVLVIDDSHTVIVILKRFLESAGCAVIEAIDAKAGLQHALTQKPELIFLDIVMPGINGFAALRALRKNANTRHIPVIMMSGNEQATAQFFGINIGADDFMKKPFSRAEVFARLQRLLDDEGVPRRFADSDFADIVPPTHVAQPASPETPAPQVPPPQPQVPPPQAQPYAVATPTPMAVSATLAPVTAGATMASATMASVEPEVSFPPHLNLSIPEASEPPPSSLPDPLSPEQFAAPMSPERVVEMPAPTLVPEVEPTPVPEPEPEPEVVPTLVSVVSEVAPTSVSEAVPMPVPEVRPTSVPEVKPVSEKELLTQIVKWATLSLSRPESLKTLAPLMRQLLDQLEQKGEEKAASNTLTMMPVTPSSWSVM